MSQKPVESRRERKKQQTRAALMEAAMALFSERGVYGTRIEDITERADLGKGAFYNYFASKEALIAELVAQGVQTLDDEYLAQLTGSASTAERIGEVARLHARFLDELPRYAVLFHQARGLLLLKQSRVEELRKVFAHYLRRVGHALVADADANVWSDEVLLDAAAALVGGLTGYRSHRIAASLAPSVSTAQDVLTRALPGVLQERRIGA